MLAHQNRTGTHVQHAVQKNTFSFCSIMFTLKIVSSIPKAPEYDSQGGNTCETLERKRRKKTLASARVIQIQGAIIYNYIGLSMDGWMLGGGNFQDCRACSCVCANAAA